METSFHFWWVSSYLMRIEIAPPVYNFSPLFFSWLYTSNPSCVCVCMRCFYPHGGVTKVNNNIYIYWWIFMHAKQHTFLSQRNGMRSPQARLVWRASKRERKMCLKNGMKFIIKYRLFSSSIAYAWPLRSLSMSAHTWDIIVSLY